MESSSLHIGWALNDCKFQITRGELVSSKKFTDLEVLNSLWEVLLPAQLPKLVNGALDVSCEKAGNVNIRMSLLFPFFVLPSRCWEACIF